MIVDDTNDTPLQCVSAAPVRFLPFRRLTGRKGFLPPQLQVDCPSPAGRDGRGGVMLRFVGAIACALVMAGCGGGAQYAMKEYTGVEVKSFDVPDEDTYRVFDKPAENKLMITPSLSKAMGAGFAQGATFGGADAMDMIGPKPMFEKAALGYFASTRRTCRIVDGYIVAKPQWEFKYHCTVPVPQQPAPAVRPRRGGG